MATPIEPSKSDNVYFIDAESGAEMARLIEQDRLITKGTGGLFTEQSDLSNIHHILDLGCGPGGWPLDVAFEYPDIQVEGVDISQAMIDYAQARARVQGLHNASFRVMDITQPLDFPDNSFDLVNGRMIGFLPTATWPKLMQESVRVTRPGGTIRMTEFESPGTTNSPALEQLIELFARALKVTGQNFSPSGRRIGITPMLRRSLQDAGCTNILQVAHVIDYSIGTEAYLGFRQDWTAAFKLLEPFLIGTGVTTQEEFDQVYNQLLIEMLQDDFCAIMFLLTVWGEKP